MYILYAAKVYIIFKIPAAVCGILSAWILGRLFLPPSVSWLSCLRCEFLRVLSGTRRR